ncbi:MAG: DUF4234 domain-containing protein [Oscillospiraceae bacterium]|jgi:uncharacterized membrane protein|nr:DUF4234 domain-containing protein [Oscillospiraceae bacterium]
MFVGKKQDPLKLILLSLVTCGIYFYYWLYKTGEEVNQVLQKEAVKTNLAWVGIICFPVGLYYLYQLDLALQEMAGTRGVQYQSNFVLWIILFLLSGVGAFVAEFQIQTFLNTCWDQAAPPSDYPTGDA